MTRSTVLGALLAAALACPAAAQEPQTLSAALAEAAGLLAEAGVELKEGSTILVSVGDGGASYRTIYSGGEWSPPVSPLFQTDASALPCSIRRDANDDPIPWYIGKAAPPYDSIGAKGVYCNPEDNNKNLQRDVIIESLGNIYVLFSETKGKCDEVLPKKLGTEKFGC